MDKRTQKIHNKLKNNIYKITELILDTLYELVSSNNDILGNRDELNSMLIEVVEKTIFEEGVDEDKGLKYCWTLVAKNLNSILTTILRCNDIDSVYMKAVETNTPFAEVTIEVGKDVSNKIYNTLSENLGVPAEARMFIADSFNTKKGEGVPSFLHNVAYEDNEIKDKIKEIIIESTKEDFMYHFMLIMVSQTDEKLFKILHELDEDGSLGDIYFEMLKSLFSTEDNKRDALLKIMILVGEDILKGIIHEKSNTSDIIKNIKNREDIDLKKNEEKLLKTYISKLQDISGKEEFKQKLEEGDKLAAFELLQDTVAEFNEAILALSPDSAEVKLNDKEEFELVI